MLAFSRRITKTSTLSSADFTEGNILLKERTQMINDKIKLHILGVSMNKLGNWLIITEERGMASRALPIRSYRQCPHGPI